MCSTTAPSYDPRLRAVSGISFYLARAGIVELRGASNLAHCRGCGLRRGQRVAGRSRPAWRSATTQWRSLHELVDHKTASPSASPTSTSGPTPLTPSTWRPRPTLMTVSPSPETLTPSSASTTRYAESPTRRSSAPQGLRDRHHRARARRALRLAVQPRRSSRSPSTAKQPRLPAERLPSVARMPRV